MIIVQCEWVYWSRIQDVTLRLQLLGGAAGVELTKMSFQGAAIEDPAEQWDAWPAVRWSFDKNLTTNLVAA